MSVINVVLLAAILALAGAATIVSPLQKNQKFGKQAGNRWQNIQSVEGVPVVPVGGDVWPVAIFWSFIEIGTPPQKFPVAIDSGSFTLDIPKIGCNGCTDKAPNQFYDPSKSSTSKQLTCSLLKPCEIGRCQKNVCVFSNTYETCDPHDPTAPCTISGEWYEDTLSFGGSGNVTAQFGVITYQTSNFEQFYNIDGVVGMASDQTIFADLVKAGAVDADVWGLCLHEGVSNGTLTLGGTDPSLYTAPPQYTPNVGGQMYVMNLLSIDVGGSAIADSKKSIIIDTGTNVLLLPDEAYSGMHDTFSAMCGSVSLVGICNVATGASLFDNECFDMTPDQLAMFPPLTLQIENVNLTMTHKDYLLQGYGTKATPSQYCLGVEKTSPGGLQILGDTTLQNYFTIFDRKENRIGWAPVNTTTCGNQPLA